MCIRDSDDTERSLDCQPNCSLRYRKAVPLCSDTAFSYFSLKNSLVCCTDVYKRQGNSLGADCEGVKLEYAHRTVPNNGACVLDSLREQLYGCLLYTSRCV